MSPISYEEVQCPRCKGTGISKKVVSHSKKPKQLKGRTHPKWEIARQRRASIIELKEVHKMTHKQVAETLGMSVHRAGKLYRDITESWNQEWRWHHGVSGALCAPNAPPSLQVVEKSGGE
jgi:hypothetical protein